jgi:hypothetical protein
MSEAVAQQAAEQEPEVDLSLAHKVIDKYIDLPGNLMPVLQGVQDEYGRICATPLRRLPVWGHAAWLHWRWSTTTPSAR